MTDTSKEATNPTWVNDACELFDQHAQELGWQRHIYSDNLRALLSERDALRAQLQAARDDALEEGIEHACAVIDAFSEYDQNECCDGRECGCYGSSVHDHMKHQIRALKSTSAEGEG